MAHSSLWLPQIHFFISLGFMALFLGISLGLSWLLAWFRFRSLRTNGASGLATYRFWARVFALALVLGVGSGVVVLIQAASLWAALFDKAGNVIGPLLAATLASGFIFKSCFLGAMLFGERRLSDSVHALVTLMVAIGLTLTVFWLLALISWMQTPAGVWMFDTQYGVRDWSEVIFNPSFPWYAGLYVLASLVCAAGLVLAVTAWQSLWQPASDGIRLAFRTALVVGSISLVLLVFVSAGAGQMMARHLPAKAAATAAYWTSGEPPDLLLFAVPSSEHRKNHAVVAVPNAGYRWLPKDDDGQFRGLDQFTGMVGPVAAIFFSYRLAWFAGAVMLLCLAATAVRMRQQFDLSALPRWWRRGLIANCGMACLLMLAGVAHVMLGANPYVIADAVTLREVTPEIDPGRLFLGILVYLFVYGVCVSAFMGLVGHAARYGVVPVTRHRGRA